MHHLGRTLSSQRVAVVTARLREVKDMSLDLQRKQATTEWSAAPITTTRHGRATAGTVGRGRVMSETNEGVGVDFRRAGVPLGTESGYACGLCGTQVLYPALSRDTNSHSPAQGSGWMRGSKSLIF